MEDLNEQFEQPEPGPKAPKGVLPRWLRLHTTPRHPGLWASRVFGRLRAGLRQSRQLRPLILARIMMLPGRRAEPPAYKPYTAADAAPAPYRANMTEGGMK